MASSLALLTLSLCFASLLASPNPLNLDYKSFLNCLSLHTPTSTNISQLLYTPTSSSFSSLLQSSIRNLRFVNLTTREPLLIITPSDEAQVRASIMCCSNHSIQMRIRSGGHDYEGLSYRSDNNTPFAILDLVHLRSIDIDIERGVAWVQSGAPLGELYYRIAEKSRLLGFPAGICPTVGMGGHISGGGFGTMLRKYGLASDGVLDAKLVDVNGNILDKESMGEDLFWAIRGGGGGSFGVVVSWKVKIVPVPPTVSVFSIHKTSSQGAIQLVNKWQYIAHGLTEDLFIRIVLQKIDQGSETEALFNSLFLGNCGELQKVMEESFPELGFVRDDCREMSWVDSVMYFAGYTNGEPLEVLMDRGSKPYRFFKAKSDFVDEPIPRFVWQKIWAGFLEEGAGVLIMDPYGGMMSRISGSETPFPHREGILYNLQYFVEWRDGGLESSRMHMDWIARLYKYMGPYVTKNPRASYFNYRDLDLGSNEEEGSVSSYSNAQIWGVKYFKGNFERLARVKGRVDPGDFFRNEQSIPPLVVEDGKEAGSGFVTESESQILGHQDWLAFFLSNMV